MLVGKVFTGNRLTSEMLFSRVLRGRVLKGRMLTSSVLTARGLTGRLLKDRVRRMLMTLAAGSWAGWLQEAENGAYEQDPQKQTVTGKVFSCRRLLMDGMLKCTVFSSRVLVRVLTSKGLLGRGVY